MGRWVPGREVHPVEVHEERGVSGKEEEMRVSVPGRVGGKPQNQHSCLTDPLTVEVRSPGV